MILTGRDSVADRLRPERQRRIYVFGTDQASAGQWGRPIYATYPDKGMFILCGTGRTRSSSTRPRAKHTVFDDCENVHVESAD